MRDLKAQNRAAASYALGVVTILNFLNYIDRFILAAVLPRVKAELVLSDFQLGLLANAFLVAYFLTSPVFGILGDRASRPRLMAAGVGLWSIATAAAGMTRNFVQLLVARAWVGVGEAAYSTISPALLADYYPRSRRGRAFAIFYVAIPVGAASGFLLGGALERAFGWRVAFYAVGLPGIVLALLAGRLRDPIRGASEEIEASSPGNLSIRTWLALTVSSSPTYIGWFFIAEFLLFLSTGPVNVVIVNVVPVGVRAMAMAVSIFVIHLLGDAISPPIIGWLADVHGLGTAVLIVPVAVAISGVVWTATALKN